ncbi:MAG: glycosyltransferase family 4 protein, partial [Anaerolineales bacterium]|nr:glycosyltransferase family 4 protein [Anaerolineales bacterium]
MSKKVLHVIDSLTPGGAERVALELVNALAEDGHPVALCATRDGLGLVPELSPAVDMFPLQRKRTWDLGAIRRLTRTIREHDVQILHAHGRSSTKFCALVKLLSGRQVGLLFHDHYGEIDIDAEAEPSLKAACRLVDRYVAVDPELAEWAVEVLGVAADLVSVIGNSIDLRR